MNLRRLVAALLCVVAALAGGVGVAPSAGAVAKGAVAREGQFPYAVQLRLDDIRRSNGTVYDSACSGALISRTWIVTAGHCFHDGNRVRVGGEPRYGVTVRLGTTSTADPAAGLTRRVVWVEQSARNDVALARLDAPVDGIAPVRLATKAPARGQVLSFAGWGATSSGGTWSDRLHWGQVTVTRVLSTTALATGRWPHRDTSACPYDSGAPYVTTARTPLLVAVESGGPACPHRGDETTARVDVLASWIRSTVPDLP